MYRVEIDLDMKGRSQRTMWRVGRGPNVQESQFMSIKKNIYNVIYVC